MATPLPKDLPNLATAAMKAFPAGTTRTFAARMVECVSVKDFGAIGNGSANDAVALQAALTFLRTTSTPSARALYIPAGTYLTNQVLYITNTQGVRIFGDGPESTKIQYTGSATAGNTEAPATGGANAFTPVIMINGFSYSTFEGMSLINKTGANTVGIYFYQDTSGAGGSGSKGSTTHLGVNNLHVYGDAGAGSIAIGYLIGYQSDALCSEIMFTNCTVQFAASYGFRNVSTNALNNNLYNCGGTHNAVWASAPTGQMNVFGASLAVNDLDIQTGTLPMSIIGCRTESLNFVDAGSTGQSFVNIMGCDQTPGVAAAGYFVSTANSTIANLVGCQLYSTNSANGKINGNSGTFITLTGCQIANATPFSGFSGRVLEWHGAQHSGTYATLTTLMPAGAHLKGVRSYVTDSTVAASTSNFSSTVTGGGANTVPVWCDGTNWRIG